MGEQPSKPQHTIRIDALGQYPAFFLDEIVCSDFDDRSVQVGRSGYFLQGCFQSSSQIQKGSHIIPGRSIGSANNPWHNRFQPICQSPHTRQTLGTGKAGPNDGDNTIGKDGL